MAGVESSGVPLRASWPRSPHGWHGPTAPFVKLRIRDSRSNPLCGTSLAFSWRVYSAEWKVSSRLHILTREVLATLEHYLKHSRTPAAARFDGSAERNASARHARAAIDLRTLIRNQFEQRTDPVTLPSLSSLSYRFNATASRLLPIDAFRISFTMYTD